MPENFAVRLMAACERKRSACVVGLDPRPELLPAPLTPPTGADRAAVADAVGRFCAGIIDAVAEQAVAVKPQIAFFEALGVRGLEAYAGAVRYAREKGLLVIGDAKRGDIGSTARAYADAHLRPGADFEVDALTVNPWLGTDSVEPFLEAAAATGKGLFVLVKTSNPSGADFQDLESGGQPVHEHVAARVTEWGERVRGAEPWSPVGAVVGATYPGTARRLRALMPRTVFLVPGYGAQGGTAEDIRVCFNREGQGAVVNASRSIIFAWREASDPDAWQDAVAEAAGKMRTEIEEIRRP
jgi:orotidine-5'-phosphate decarboxylase